MQYSVKIQNVEMGKSVGLIWLRGVRAGARREERGSKHGA